MQKEKLRALRRLKPNVDLGPHCPTALFYFCALYLEYKNGLVLGAGAEDQTR